MKTAKTGMILCLMLALACSWFGAPAARSQQNAVEAKPQKWEYLTDAVEALSLQAKLTELANANWEVVAVAISDSIVDPGDKPRLRVEKFQIVVRRPLK